MGPDGKPTGELDSFRQAMKPLRALYGNTLVTDFGPLSLKAVRRRFLDKGLVRKSVNKQVRRIKRIFKWGVENELVPPGIEQALSAVEGLKKGRTEAPDNPPVKPISWEDVVRIRPFVARQVWAMVHLQWLTGMRSSEVTAMRMCDIVEAERMLGISTCSS